MKFKFLLNPKEAENLHKALGIYTSNLRNEISRTDDLNFRAGLQDEWDTLKSIENRLSGYIVRGFVEEEEKKAG